MQLLLYNRTSGGFSESVFNKYFFADSRFHCCDVLEHDCPPSDLSTYSSIIIAGGDDTIRKVIQTILPKLVSMSPTIPISLFPSGTVCDLHRSLSIPLSPTGFFSFQEKADLRDIDYVLARSLSEDIEKDVLFLSKLSTGFLVELHHRVFRNKLPSSQFSYYFQILPALLATSSENYVLKVDDVILERSAIGIFVLNAPSTGGLNWSPEINPSDGYLDLFIYQGAGLLQKLSKLRGFFGGFQKCGEHIRCRKVEILEPADLQVLVDGELELQTPVVAEICSKPLKFHSGA
ncbi:hypothetical protein P9112_002972 [Eukaryota sp. TZLM1-RC]